MLSIIIDGMLFLNGLPSNLIIPKRHILLESILDSYPDEETALKAFAQFYREYAESN
jgi:hypothetical protein